MLQAVIFDFDGVITDSEILHLRAFNKVLAQFDSKIARKDYYKKYLGSTDIEVFESLVKENKLNPGDMGLEGLVQQKSKIFKKISTAEGKIIEGVRDFLKMLKQNNVRMAICSGALLAEIELILTTAQLRSFFDVIVSAEQVKKGKPDPEGFLLTLAKLNETTSNPISADQCVAIEDSHWGLQAAKAAGMHTVAVTNSYDAEQLKIAEKIVTKLSEISIEELQEICG